MLTLGGHSTLSWGRVFSPCWGRERPPALQFISCYAELLRNLEHLLSSNSGTDRLQGLHMT